MSPATGHRPLSRRRVLTGSALAVGALATGAGLAACSTGTAQGASAEPTTDGRSDAAEPNDVDRGFCADMTAHHVQALVMCQRVLGRGTGDAVQAAAAEVLQNQAIEVGMMRAWLADWGLSTAPPELAMGWMGMNDGAGMPLAMMPGLASPEELNELSQADGLEQGRLWLVLMRAHHVGGVAMAEAAADGAATEKVRSLAGIQAAVQAFEIEIYDQLLATTYAA